MKQKIITTLWSALFLICAFTASAADRPNIVYIISDDQAWTDYGFMGHPHIRTPNLDKLARQSVVFERGYVPTALCRPSLATLATGQYAHKHGVTGNDPSPKYAQRGSDIMNQRKAKLISYLDKFDTLPELLGEKGYLSHQSGKWWEGNHKHGGFTHGMTRGFPERGGRHGDDGLKIGRTGMEPIEKFVDHAVAEKKPFFLWYGVFLPHTPHNPPERLLKPYRDMGLPLPIAKYYANCTWFDETCGQLIDILEKRKLRDNTLIVYVTDNGWINRTDRSAYAPRSKQTPYEGGIRTPIMFSWPNGDLKNGKRKDVVSSIDLFPTVLAATGARVPDGLPGLNLMDSLKEEKPVKRKGIFGETFAHDSADGCREPGSLPGLPLDDRRAMETAPYLRRRGQPLQIHPPTNGKTASALQPAQGSQGRKESGRSKPRSGGETRCQDRQVVAGQGTQGSDQVGIAKPL